MKKIRSLYLDYANIFAENFLIIDASRDIRENINYTVKYVYDFIRAQYSKCGRNKYNLKVCSYFLSRYQDQ